MSHEAKKKLRKKFLQLLKDQKDQDQLVKSRLIQKKLWQRQEFRNAKTILFYASFAGEVVTFEMIKEATQLNKKVALPIIMQNSKDIIPAYIQNLDQLQECSFGIKQPAYSKDCVVDLAELDLVVVPGLAFDRHHNRLGRGAGYYDRFLAKLPEGIPSIGLAYDFQMVDLLPHLESHDVALTDVIHN